MIEIRLRKPDPARKILMKYSLALDFYQDDTFETYGTRRPFVGLIGYWPASARLGELVDHVARQITSLHLAVLRSLETQPP